ncbi:MAG: hypothetical protein FJ148_12960 [Deltaproteobacteria bacterium]|nr:hypothetical protein [Deltaproteobacteria bacterium]
MFATVGSAVAGPANQPPSSPEALSLRLLKVKHGKASLKGSNPVVVTTGPERMGYAVSIAVPEKFDRFASCEISTTLRVKSGHITMAALTRDQSKFVATKQPIDPTKNPAVFKMTVAPMSDVGEILFANAARTDDSPSVFEVSEITVGPCK